MDDQIFDKVKQVDLKKTMETSYIDYAMSVIASRALPDVRDGLKPVQRRVLYSMIELNNGPDKPHRKCARIVGDTMGKYHPHGDSSIYGALVNMAQEWSFRYPLVDGHGNFGSVDGDGAAAMRYTEARLSKISMEMLADINKDTVDFVPNFDETEKEPVVLPSRYPNLLVNGTTGIAVGMATNIPPHNLPDNTAWMKGLEFYIETDWGMKFDAASSGIISTGSTDSPSMVSYRADSSYFYEADHLKLVITGAQWLRKDMETTYINLITGEHGELPEGAEFDSARKVGNEWVVKFRAKFIEDDAMYQLFGNKFYDADGNEYEINQWSSTYGDFDEDGNATFFYDEFPLKKFTGDEVWLTPHYSHNWVAEDQIVITVQ